MKKLRKDITIWEWGQRRDMRIDYILLLSDLQNDRVSQDYPESFFEQPPPKSFGKFWDNGKPVYNYLDRVCDDGTFLSMGGLPWKHFSPCLPDDVDENGYPKEESE